MKRYEGSPAVIIERRKGTTDSPFIDMNESLVITSDGKVVLTEIPNELNKVIVTSDDDLTWYEVKDKKIPENGFKVDYVNKIVTFNISHVGKQLHFEYVGEGNHYYSPHSIYTKLEDKTVVETLGDIVEGGKQAMDVLGVLNEKLEEVTQATNNAITATKDTKVVIDKGELVIDDATEKIDELDDKIAILDDKLLITGNKLKEVDDSLLEVDNTLKNANQAIDDISLIINDAEQATTNANAAANNATLATTMANAATTAANTATTKANLATQDTNNAIADANTAAQEASTAAEKADTAANRAATATLSTSAARTQALAAAASANDAAAAANAASENIKGWGGSVEWVAGTYDKNNVVTSNGSTFQARKDGVTSEPPNPPVTNDDWLVFAQRGVDGTGSVSTVNNQSPDGAGNVQLTAGNIGAYTTAQVDDKVDALDTQLSTQIATLNAQGTALTNSVDDINTRLVAEEGKVTTLRTDVDQTKTDLTALSQLCVDDRSDLANFKKEALPHGGGANYAPSGFVEDLKIYTTVNMANFGGTATSPAVSTLYESVADSKVFDRLKLEVFEGSDVTQSYRYALTYDTNGIVVGYTSLQEGEN